MLPTITALLKLGHAGVGALWLGSMAYSLLVVQPRLARMFPDPAATEDAQRELARGNRWPVAGLIAVLWLTGAGLVAAAPGAGGWWWGSVALKAGLLGAATGLFWWVSWRGWPRRVFALPGELPALQRRFRRVAVTMLVLVGAALSLGVLTG